MGEAAAAPEVVGMAIQGVEGPRAVASAVEMVVETVVAAMAQGLVRAALQAGSDARQCTHLRRNEW